MKMKKLLAVGAFGVVLACSTSIGASAATTLTAQQEKVIKSLISTYNDGGKSVNNLNVTKDTAVNSVVNTGSAGYTRASNTLDNYNQGRVVLAAIGVGADIDTILDGSLEYALNENNFNTYKTIVSTLGNKLMDIDKTTDLDLRVAKEKKAAGMVNSTYGTVKFGKNSAGVTTVSLENNNKVIIQLSANNANTILSIFDACDTYSEFSALMNELGLAK